MIFQIRGLYKVVGVFMLLILGVSGLALADGNIVQSNEELPKGYFVTTKSEWNKLKKEVELPPDIRALTPNFAETALVLVSWGQKPSAGFRVEIAEIQFEEKNAQVIVNYQAPPEGSLTASVITYPADAQEIERSKVNSLETVTFVDSEGRVLDKVQVTSPQYYTVQKGDSLWEIAKRQGRRLKGEVMDFIHQVLVWNELKGINLITPGQKLIIPGSTSGSADEVKPVLDNWELEQNLYAALEEKVSPALAGFSWPETGSEATSEILVLEASSRLTGITKVEVRISADGSVSVGETRTLARYTATGPWIKDESGEVIADVRDVEGASVVNCLAVSPSRNYLAIGARGYQNMLLLLNLSTGELSQVKRYPDELVSKIAWSTEGRYFTIELAGAWGKSRLENFTAQGAEENWGIEEHWPPGYNLFNPRWSGSKPVLSFTVKTIGLEAATDGLEGDWVYDPEANRLHPAGAEGSVL